MPLPKKFMICAALYGLCGMIMGTTMGIMNNFTLAPVHAHLNLLGFVVISIYGLAYQAFPEMQTSKLAKLQIYTVNAGVLVLIPALALFLLGNQALIPVMAVGELLTIVSMILFIANIWTHRSN